MKDIELIDHTLQRIAQYGDSEIEISTKHLEKICKLALEHSIEQSHKHGVMQVPQFEELLQVWLDELPYTKHLDDGQYNDGQAYGFECGAQSSD